MSYRFGDHELDTALCEIRRDGEPVHVQPRVFDLIQYLIEIRYRVVSKEELLVNVWRGASVSEAALTSAVRDARRALGDSGSAQRVIATVSRRGFRFVAPVQACGAAPEAAQGGTPVTGRA